MNSRIRNKDIDFPKCFMLGTLAEGYSNYPGIGEMNSVISPLKNSNGIVFYINALSPDPEPIVELDIKNGRHDHFYIGFDNSDMFPSNFFPIEYGYKDANQRSEFVYNKLKDKLIVFQPILKPDNKQDNRLHKNLKITFLEEEVKFNKDSSYIPVPIVLHSNAEFERRMNNKEVILLSDYPHDMSAPEYIICENSLYISSDWIKDPAYSTAWIQTKPEQMKKIDKSDGFSKDIISKISNDLIFLEQEFLYALSKEAKILSESENSESIPGNKSNTENTDDKIPSEENDQNEGTHFSYNKVELLFLDILKKKSLKQKLIYSSEDLYNFHVSVKTNPLTIISGMTGTGKSELAMLYGESLGLKLNDKQSNNLLFMPISPSYTDPGDILGYLNPVSNLYMASGTDLVDFLVHANNNREKMHMVIFDEMNLSQVEHWFAPFISMLELKEGKRFLPLYSEQIKAHNTSIYPPKIPINNNVIFVGTVNMDETTKDFSDRVLDRANIITLKKQNFFEAKKEIKESGAITSNESEIEDANEIFPRTETYRSWIYTDETWTTFSDKELEFFDKLHHLLHDADAKTGVSFRVLDRIGKYLNNIPNSASGKPLLSRKEAIDLQIKQRILTKVRGSVEQYENIIGLMSKNDNEPIKSKLYELFNGDDVKDISDFKETMAMIRKKARELTLNGYTT